MADWMAAANCCPDSEAPASTDQKECEDFACCSIENAAWSSHESDNIDLEAPLLEEAMPAMAQDVALPIAVSTSCRSGVVRGRTTAETSSSGEASKK